MTDNVFDQLEDVVLKSLKSQTSFGGKFKHKKMGVKKGYNMFRVSNCALGKIIFAYDSKQDTFSLRYEEVPGKSVAVRRQTSLLYDAIVDAGLEDNLANSTYVKRYLQRE